MHRFAKLPPKSGANHGRIAIWGTTALRPLFLGLHALHVPHLEALNFFHEKTYLGALAAAGVSNRVFTISKGVRAGITHAPSTVYRSSPRWSMVVLLRLQWTTLHVPFVEI